MGPVAFLIMGALSGSVGRSIFSILHLVVTGIPFSSLLKFIGKYS